MKKLQNGQAKFRCVLHGSFRKHLEEIKRTHRLFNQAGVEVLAPAFSEIKYFEDGFAVLESDKEKDRRTIELLYLHHLKRLGDSGFSYFVNPDGYIGKNVAYELGIAHISNIPCFFKERLDDHPAYQHKNSIWKAEELIEHIKERGELPEPRVRRNEKIIHKMWRDLMVPGSVVAVGAIIEYESSRPKKEKEVLLVKTHKWGGRYSMVGGKVRRNERLLDALQREIKEETGLRAKVGRHICTFDQIKNSGYYQTGVSHVFVDNAVQVDSKKVRLNEEAQGYIWMPVRIALRDLPIEPNARHTLGLYVRNFATRI